MLEEELAENGGLPISFLRHYAGVRDTPRRVAPVSQTRSAAGPTRLTDVTTFVPESQVKLLKRLDRVR
jgi:hypothetical protein